MSSVDRESSSLLLSSLLSSQSPQLHQSLMSNDRSSIISVTSTTTESSLREYIRPVLQQLWLEDNPISETKAKLQIAVSFLTQNIPSLVYIDSKDVSRNIKNTTNAVASKTFDVLAIRGTKRIDNNNNSDSSSGLYGISNEKGLDAMD